MTNRDNTATTYLSDQEERMLESLAAHLYDCSGSGALREMIRETYYQTFGDVKPRELDGPHLDQSDVDAMIYGELEPDGLSAEIRIDDSPDLAIPTDGGAVPQPDSYSALPSPKSLEQPGATLTWDELKDVVDDDGHWSEDLTIHPDRVPVYDADADVAKEDQKRLRTKPEYASRILAAVARHETDVNGQVFGETIDELIDEYVFPLHDWADENAAQRFFRDKYGEKIVSHFWEHPNPAVDLYFINEHQYEESVKSNVDRLTDEVRSPEPTGDVETLLDYKTGYLDNQDRVHDSRSAMDWKEHVGDWVEDLAFLRDLQVEHLPDVNIEIDYPDDCNDPIHFATKLVNLHFGTFKETLPDETRDEVFTHHVRDEFEAVLRRDT